MSKESLVLILGLIVLAVPGSGLPEEWVIYILRAAGVLLIILGFLLRRASYYRRMEKGSEERAADSFIDSSHEVPQSVKE